MWARRAARQRPLRAFSKDRASAVRDGVHQKHQRHAGRHVRQDVEFHGFRAFQVFLERDGIADSACPDSSNNLRISLSAFSGFTKPFDISCVIDGAAHTSLFKARDEFVHDGFDHARARGARGICIHFDPDGFRLHVI
jgi:hypothetical protein